ncbi:sugar ABC transporter substrate-binding protein [Clostridia bacterium]|nr:sugar ABC transporter substrate-binding protein [Clostridia bacterium]
MKFYRFMKKAKTLTLTLMTVMVLSLLASCVTVTYGGGGGNAGSGGGNSGGGEGGSAKPKVGISMSDKTLQRWKIDGENMEKFFKEAGYDVELKYAENKVDTQINQIDAMVSSGVQVLVIAPIDAGTLSPTLERAKQNGVTTVISYDRLIIGTDLVDYYVTFDNAKVGSLQGEYIRDKLDLENQAGPFNVELFTGPTSDNNVNFFFTQGAMKVLQPYIDTGKLVVKSGQVTKEQCATPDWDSNKAQARMETLISADGYSPNGTPLSAVLSSNDSVAQGVSKALKDAGYVENNFPILTGQDAEVANVKLIIDGQQGMTVFKDVRNSAAAVVKMVDEITAGQEVTVNNTTDYDNGKGIVPAFCADPVVITKDNYKELLIDSGYYEESQLK